MLAETRRKAGAVLGGCFGITLMLWICIQFYIFPMNFMSTSYFIFGVCQAAAGYAAWVFEKQEAFAVNPGDYQNVGKDPKRLVVFFSRMGYVKKKAYEEADRTGRRYMRSKPQKERKGHWAFGGAAALGCTAWKCPLNPSHVIFRHMNISPSARPSGSFPLQLRSGAFAGKLQGG